MAVGDYATRGDLDGVREALTRDLRDTERLLRDRDDERERLLRAEFVAAVSAATAASERRFDHIDEVLSEQNKYIMRRRFSWSTWRRDTLALTLSGVAVALVLHFVFGI